LGLAPQYASDSTRRIAAQSIAIGFIQHFAASFRMELLGTRFDARLARTVQKIWCRSKPFAQRTFTRREPVQYEVQPMAQIVHHKPFREQFSAVIPSRSQNASPSQISRDVFETSAAKK
jgi:hypothetical protein